MTQRGRIGGAVFWGSIALALLLSLIALPDVVRPLKPFWLALVVIYWGLEAPERMGLGLAFVLGICADFLTGSLIGEQAARLAILAFIVLRLRSRMRFFPMLQQALAVLALLVNDRVVQLAIRSFTGDPIPPISYWLAPVSGMLLWPWLFLMFDLVRQRLRTREA
jgi:rod shape-determining protein MreD